ncbi:hypothetical protein Tco_0839694 [Tanacetum coccineum]|uniref:Uncharacterized protein n=1 Tax=Tanacetum coccineum TaxID=301880 RepID=A0ABQ5AUI6_9ASTR
MKQKVSSGGYLSFSAMLMLSTKGFENLIASGLSSNVMTSKDMKKADVLDSLMKNFIRSFKMSFHNGGSVLSVASSGYSFSPVLCVGRGEFFRDPFFIIEVDNDVIPEFSTIVSSELFDFDVILIFNSFDEVHDSFRSLTFLLQEIYPGVP